MRACRRCHSRALAAIRSHVSAYFLTASGFSFIAQAPA